MNRIIEFFARQTLFGNILTLFVILVGLVSLTLIRREVFPNVTYDMITVTTVFPAASPEEVEQLVTNPLEKDLREVDGLKRVRSHSVEGRSVIVLQLDPDQTTEEKAKSDIRDIVDRIKPELPEECEEPLITALESKQQPIIEVAVSGDIPEIELREAAKFLEDEIEDIHGVARVNPVGMRDLEMRVETRQPFLSKYQLTLDDLVAALRSQNLSIPGGTIESPKSKPEAPERMVRTTGQFTDLEGVRDTVVRANDLGNPIRVGDVANVRFDLERATLIDHVNGKRSIRLTVLKKEKADAITVVNAVTSLVERLKPQLDKRIEVDYVNDLSILIKRRLSILSGNLIVGLFLVFFVLSLFLPWKIALIVSLGIPFSFLGTMILFNAWDYSVNLISMIGLIIVSGMLVDDAIVVTDNCVRKMEEGLSPVEAAVKGAQEIWIPVTASVMTTIVVFLPMLYMSGIFGKFVREIPTGVIIALFISLAEAFFILPGHISKWIRIPSRRSPSDRPRAERRKRFDGLWNDRIVPAYVGAVRWCVSHRYLVVFAGFLVVIGSFGLAAFGMRFVLFPADEIEIFMIRAQSPTGTSLVRTEALAKPIEDAVKSLPKEDLKNFLTTVGQFVEGPEVKKRGPEFVQVLVFLTPPNERERTDSEIIDEVRRKVGTPPGFVNVSFERVQGGPPVGKPVDLGVRAKEYEDILPAVAHLKELLSKMDGVTDIEDSYLLGKEEYRVKVNAPEAGAARVSVAEIGNTVRASYEGLVATTVRKLDEEIDVRVSLSGEERASESALQAIRIPNRLQNLIPINRVTTITSSQSLAEYEHEGFERQVRVTGMVDIEKTTAAQANSKVRDLLPALREKFPKVTVAFGGEDQDTQESMASLGRAFVVAIMGVFLILVMTFRNLLHPILVFLTIPLGLASVILAFFVHGKPLTFMGMLGAVALAGVIVNNAIVFIDFVHASRMEGKSNLDSLLETARVRLRPIVLTTATTVVGLMPTTYGIGGLDRFVVYITMALGWGMLFGSLLTCFLMPAAIAITDDMSGLFRKWFPKTAEV